MEETPKDLHFNEEGRQKLIQGIKKIAGAVKSTLGPLGNTVLIESLHHTHGITVTKDGVTVAKSVNLADPVENLAVNIMKEAADKTASIAGDGTTTAIVLAEAIVLEGSRLIGAEHNRSEVISNMVDLSNNIIKKIKEYSIDVSDSMLIDIASISANNNTYIGNIIADTYKAVGKGGVVRSERSQTTDTYSEVIKGLKVSRGYSSPLFINDRSRDECVLEDVYILVADVEISNILQIENMLKPVITGGKKLLVIAPCSTNVINTFAANVIKNNLKLCIIPPPGFGYRQHELMHDIAVSVGATYFSEKTGDDLSHISFDDLGHASKVIVSSDATIILKSDIKSNSVDIEDRVKQLWDSYNNTSKKSDKDFILERIGSLTGGIGVIYVGGNTDLEQKELYDRVDDAVNAVRSAIEEGVLAGGGKVMYSLDVRGIAGEISSKEKEIAVCILEKALKAPLTQILNNAGLKVEDYYTGVECIEAGLNVKTREFGNLIDMGIIDPYKVTRSAIQNAVSVGATILSTNAIITLCR